MRIPWFVSMLAAFVALGCGTKVGDVSGRVSYRNKPIESGSVLFLVGSTPHYAEIEPGGAFNLKSIPAGEAKVGISSPNPTTLTIKVNKPGMQTAASTKPAVDPRKWFALPARFADPSTSGLTFKVEPGPNAATFELKDD